jgi:hypothetical protein
MEKAVASALQASLAYLESDAAMRSIATNVYWPKWDSPWWQMTLLHEMGLAREIPQRAVHRMVSALQAFPLKIFPIHASDNPSGLDLGPDSMCHCAIGNMAQTLAAAGVDLDESLPWMREWLAHYQLPDGGHSCDNAVYGLDPAELRAHPPSSLVGTIATLEALLLHTPRALTPTEESVLDRGARFLLSRELRLGSRSPHNADERDDENDWLRVAFPRFYFYDVLRGLHLVLEWAERREQRFDRAAIETVVASLETRFGRGPVRIERHAYGGTGTRKQDASRRWIRGHSATVFPLLEEVSGIGRVSPELSAQWRRCRELLARHP